jgi:hypothetical protein
MRNKRNKDTHRPEQPEQDIHFGMRNWVFKLSAQNDGCPNLWAMENDGCPDIIVRQNRDRGSVAGPSQPNAAADSTTTRTDL